MTEIVPAPAESSEEPFRPQPDGSIDPAGEAGWFLQRERERRGLPLADITAETGIHESHLDAIEHGDLTRLPSRMEALKMVGIYGQYLGFDPEPLILHYAQFLPRPITAAKPPGSPTPRPLSSATVIPLSHVVRRGPLQRMSRTVGSCLAVVVAFGLAMWFLVPGTPGEQVTAAIDPLPTASVAPDDGLDAEQSLAAQVSIVETPLSDDQPLPAPEPGPAARQAGEQDTLAALIVRTLGQDDLEEGPGLDEAGLSFPTESAREGRNVGEENSAARIVLKAKGPVLIRIEDARGNVVASHTLATGDFYQVPSRDDLVVVAGDGGLVGVEVDGVGRGTLGTPGEIVVGRPLTVPTFLGGQG